MGDSNFSGKNKVLNAKTILHDHQQQEEKEEEQFLWTEMDQTWLVENSVARLGDFLYLG